MTATVNGSAYPLPVDELLPAARKLAEELGEVPSRNRLMSELRIGAPKAQTLREKLLELELRRRLADQFGYTPPDDRRAPYLYPKPIGPDLADAPTATWPAYKPSEVVDEAYRIFERTGKVPTADDLVQELGMEPGEARKVADLIDVAEKLRGRLADRRQAKSDPEPDPGLAAGSGGSGVVTIPAPSLAPTAPQPAPTAVLRPSLAPVEPTPAPAGHPGPSLPVEPLPPVKVTNAASLVTVDGHPGPAPAPAARRKVATWPVWLLALPAFVAIWSGWVGLGSLTGFGVVHPLPGIAEGVRLNTAILLPVGVETYGAFALRIWMSGRVPTRARRFAKWSAIGSLLLGGVGQVAYHLMTATGMTSAPWWITTLVSCLPVAVLGMGAALAHLLHADES